MDSKPFYMSKVLWFNVVAVIVVVAKVAGYADFVPDPEVVAVFDAVANLVLRFVTKQPVALRLPSRGE